MLTVEVLPGVWAWQVWETCRTPMCGAVCVRLGDLKSAMQPVLHGHFWQGPAIFSSPEEAEEAGWEYEEATRP